MARILIVIVLFLMGCDDDNNITKAEIENHVEWGRDASIKMQAFLCDTEDAFSIQLASSSKNNSFSRRRLCRIPRPLSELDKYNLKGEISGSVFNQHGEQVKTCVLTYQNNTSFTDIDFSSNSFICTSTKYKSYDNSKINNNIINLSILDFVDTENNILVDSLIYSIEEIDANYDVQLIINEGKFYLDKPIIVNRSISIKGVSLEKSSLVASTDELINLLQVQPLARHPFKLASNINKGENWLSTNESIQEWVTDDCSTLVIKDKSHLWPFDPRENVFYGEISNIKFSIGNVLTLAEPLRSDYSSDSELLLICDAKVLIQDLEFAFKKEALNSKAIAIEHAFPVIINNIKVSNSGRVGIWVSESRDVTISNNTLIDGFPIDCKTCYGIQSYGSQDVLIASNTISGFRRGIDVSGYIPSRRVVVTKNFIQAESEATRGASALGTHGSAEEVVFSLNETHGGIISLLSRGNEIIINNNTLLDSEYSSIYLATGSINYIWSNTLGGYRENGRLTNRGIEFKIPELHLLTEISDNKVTANVGVRITQTPHTINIKNNTLVNGITSVSIENGVVINGSDNIELIW